MLIDFGVDLSLFSPYWLSPWTLRPGPSACGAVEEVAIEGQQSGCGGTRTTTREVRGLSEDCFDSSGVSLFEGQSIQICTSRLLITGYHVRSSF